MNRNVIALPLAGAVAALAIGVGVHDADASSTSSATGASAVQTVRDFLADSALDRNGDVACRYLAGSAAHDCSAQLIAAPPSLPGIHSDTRLKKVLMTATVHGDSADVHVQPRGDATFTVVLARATAPERDAFGAPPSAWRIARL